eukprot:m51a1_g1148 hypothetical protein (117) ;mRNA; f:283447-284056
MSESGVVGTYEYVKPGTDKSTQTLVLKPDHTASFSERSDNSLETVEAKGEGSWSVAGDQLKVVLSYLDKTIKIKRTTLVPGIESGNSHAQNVAIPLTLKEIVNAPAHGTNKWKRVN